MKPITPDEVVQKKKESLPPEVIEAANELIARKWNGYESVFTIDELGDKIKEKLPESTAHQAEDEHWYDIEDIYRENGWKVVYDKTGYNDPASDTYTFTKKK